MASFSSVGKKLYAVYGALFLVNLLVLIFSARVNEFQEFFFVADLFPLGLSIVTLVVLFFMFSLDFALKNSFTARAPFSIGVLVVLSIFWLAFNAFSTARWRHVPLNCSSIPDNYPDEKAWCRDLQALKSFVWIEWVMMLLTGAFVTRFATKQHSKGNTHVWRTPLSRYVPHAGEWGIQQRQSDFLPFEKVQY